MTLATPSECRPLPVRLTQVKPEVRWSAARKIAAREPAWAVAVLAAALNPSNTTYYIAAEAWMDLAEVAA